MPESVRGQGVAVTGAARWHKAGARGRGVKVAVVDLGFSGYRRSQATGDLPGSAVKVDFCGPGGFEATSHGTAVAEIVAEMAPDAKLYLVCIKDVAGLGLAVAYARPTESRSSATPRAGSTQAVETARARLTRRKGSSPRRGPRGSSG